MKKQVYILCITFLLVLGGLILAFGSNLEGASPGGPGDPLVTQSYVNMRFNQLEQMIAAGGGQVNTDAIVSQVLADITTFFGDNLSATFVPVFVPAGSILFAGEGTEIIPRSGTVRAHVPGPDGIVNVTLGQDMAHAAALSHNHLLIVPREDGRGILAVTDAWFIVKGSYRIATN